MKTTITSLLLLFLSLPVFSQWHNDGFTFETANRQYRVYVPVNYNASNPASLVLTLHGLGDNMTNFSGIGMNYVADSANIIVVVPQALTDQLVGSSAWNSGAAYMGYVVNSTVNDVGFISALIDSVSAEYSIDPEKVFACGFSMGGFMTERLALELNGKIKAFASVAGTFGDGILPAGNPGRPVSIAHFHGTSDGTIAYTGNAYGNDVSELLDFWVNHNNCNSTPTITNLPDIAADGYTVEHWVYDGGDNNTVVEHFKVNGADHVWLAPSNDIFYTTEIWNFFNRYMQTLATTELDVAPTMVVVPNPVTDNMEITLAGNQPDGVYEIAMTDLSGKAVYSDNMVFTGKKSALSVESLGLKTGVYLLTIANTQMKAITTRIMIR